MEVGICLLKKAYLFTSLLIITYLLLGFTSCGGKYQTIPREKNGVTYKKSPSPTLSHGVKVKGVKKPPVRYGEDPSIRKAKRKYLPREVWDVAGSPDLSRERVYFEKAIRENPSNPEPIYFLGFNYFEARMLKKSAETFERVLKLKPDHELALENLTLVYFQDHRYKEAEETTRKGLKYYPDNPRLIYMLGQCFLSGDKDSGKAVEVYRNALRRGIKSPHIYTGLAEVYIEENGEGSSKARKLLEQCVKEYPGYPNALMLLAEIYLENGDAGKAISLLRKLIETVPSFNDAKRLLGEVYIETGNYKKAEGILLLSLEHRPDNVNEIRNLLGEAYIEQGEFVKARKILDKITNKGNSDPDYRENLVKAYLQLALVDIGEKKLDLAEDFIEKAAKEKPDKRFFNYVKSHLLTARGDFKGAERLLQDVLEEDEGDSPLPLYRIYFAIALIREASGDNNGVEEFLKKSRDKASGYREKTLRFLIKKHLPGYETYIFSVSSGNSKITNKKNKDVAGSDNHFQKIEKKLLADLKNSSPKVRWDAAANLGMIRSKKSVPYLIKSLKDKNGQVRLLSAWALGRIRDKQASAPLQDAVTDPWIEVRPFAIWALGEIKEPASAVFLNERLFIEEETGTREAIIKSLGKIASPTSVPVIIKALKDSDENVRAEAAMALAGFNDNRAVPPLVESLEDNEEAVVMNAIVSLYLLKPDVAIVKLKEFSRHKNFFLRGKASRFLRAIENGNRKAVILGDANVIHKMEMILEASNQATLSLGDISMMNPEDTQNIATLPIKIGMPVNVSGCIKDLESEIPDIRSESAWLLGNSGDKRAVPALIKALGDKDSSVRWSAAKSLGKLGDKRAFTPLIQIIKDPDKDVREDVVEALGGLGDERAVKPLIRVIKDRNEYKYIKGKAVESLGRIRKAEAFGSLLKVLKDPSPELRISAVVTLGCIKEKKAIPDLEKLKWDPDKRVRESAVVAIEVIKGKRDKEDLERFNLLER